MNLKYKHHCKRCDKDFETIREVPSVCRHCNSPLWNKDRIHSYGGRNKKDEWIENAFEVGRQQGEAVRELEAMPWEEAADKTSEKEVAWEKPTEDIKVGVDLGVESPLIVAKLEGDFTEPAEPVSEMPRAVASKVVPKKQVAESNSERLRRLREQKQEVESEIIDPERADEVKKILCGSGSETGVLEEDLFVEPERELVKDPEDSGEEVRAPRPAKVLPKKPRVK